MSSRVGGAVLALTAAALLAWALASSGWWSGHPTVDTTTRHMQDVYVGLHGGQLCNTGGDGTCKPLTLRTPFEIVAYVELALGSAIALAALGLAALTWKVHAGRKRLGRLVVAGAALGALLAITLVIIGPSAQASMPFGIGLLMFALGAAGAVAAGFVARLDPPLVRLRPPQPQPPSQLPPQPVEPIDVLALFRDEASIPAPTVPPESLRPPRAPSTRPPPSPGGALPGPAGPLGVPPPRPHVDAAPAPPPMPMPVAPRPPAIEQPETQPAPERPKTLPLPVHPKPVTLPPPMPIAAPPPVVAPAVPTVIEATAAAKPPEPRPKPSTIVPEIRPTLRAVVPMPGPIARAKAASIVPPILLKPPTTGERAKIPSIPPPPRLSPSPTRPPPVVVAPAEPAELPEVDATNPSLAPVGYPGDDRTSPSVELAAGAGAADDGNDDAATTARERMSARELGITVPITDTDKSPVVATEATGDAPRPSAKHLSTAPASLPPPKDEAAAGPSPACPQCEAPMAWVDEHLRFYCKSCRMYF